MNEGTEVHAIVYLKEGRMLMEFIKNVPLGGFVNTFYGKGWAHRDYDVDESKLQADIDNCTATLSELNRVDLKDKYHKCIHRCMQYKRERELQAFLTYWQRQVSIQANNKRMKQLETRLQEALSRSTEETAQKYELMKKAEVWRVEQAAREETLAQVDGMVEAKFNKARGEDSTIDLLQQNLKNAFDRLNQATESLQKSEQVYHTKTIAGETKLEVLKKAAKEENFEEFRSSDDEIKKAEQRGAKEGAENKRKFITSRMLPIKTGGKIAVGSLQKDLAAAEPKNCIMPVFALYPQ